MPAHSENLPKAGETYRCDVCGMEIQVTKDCQCEEGAPRMECCNKPLSRES